MSRRTLVPVGFEMPVNVALPLRVMVLPTVDREIVENEAWSLAVSALPSAPVPTVGEAVPTLANETLCPIDFAPSGDESALDIGGSQDCGGNYGCEKCGFYFHGFLRIKENAFEGIPGSECIVSR